MKRLQVLLAGLLSLSILASAHATLIVEISDTADFSGTVVSAIDTDGDGMVNVSSGLGSWIANVVTGFSSPIIGGDYIEAIDLNSVNVSGGSGTIYLRLIETAMTKNSATYIAALGGTTDGSISFSGTVSDGVDTAEVASYTANSGAFSYENIGNFALQSGNYTAMLTAAITHKGAGQISSFDFNLKVPEPGSLALLGLGLIGLGFGAKRRK